MQLFESLVHDSRYALRAMRSSIGLTIVAILSLSLGIGATIAIFSVMYALVLKPLPVFQPERLVEIPQSDGFNGHSYAEWKEFQKRQDIFSNAFAYNWMDADFHLRDGVENQKVMGIYVSGDYFTTLGVPAVVGRTLVASDDQPGATPVCVIGYGLWRRMYGSSRDAIGRMLVINGHAFQIIGVAPQSFFGVDVGSIVEVFAPLSAEMAFQDYQIQWGRHTPSLASPTATILSIVGRLKSGVTVSQADARLHVIGREIYKALPPIINDRTGKPFPMSTLMARAMPNGISGARESWSETVELLLAMAGALLLIACTNLGNLLLARATRRQGEIATRLALGATRWRLTRQLLMESVALAAVGAALGLIAAHWGSELLLSAISWPDSPTELILTWDWKLAAFVVGTTLSCALLFGLAPAIRATRVPLYSAMNRNSSGSTGNVGHRLSNNVLIVAQVTLSVALLVSAGLLVRTLDALLAKDPGYDAKNVLIVGTGTEASGASAARQALIGSELLETFRALPGVISASRTAVDSNLTGTTAIISQPGGGVFRLRIYQIVVSPGYFKTRRTPILMGRDFNAADNQTSLPVVILSDEAAREFFPGRNPVGLRFHEKSAGAVEQEHFVEVVGVAKDIDYQRPSDSPLRIVYRPVAQCSSCGVGSYELRYVGVLPEVMKRVKNAAANVDPHLALNFHLLSDQIKDVVKRNRVTALLAAFFGLLTATLAMIGVYGVTSYTASQRTREIGIRMALGAQPANVFRMVLQEMVVVVLAGVALGAIAGYAAGQSIRDMLWRVSPTDPLSFAGAACAMLFIAALAALIPARRAMRTDPMLALRSE